MSTSPITLADRRSHRLAILADYVELTKPKIAIMLLAAVAVSSFVATWGQPSTTDLINIINVVLGTALVAASSCVWNQWYERHIDGLMPRTKNRPLPAGRISPTAACMFGTILGSVGVAYLAATVSWLCAAIGLLTWIIYVCIYTPMKQTSPWNTTIGAVAGALPLWMGWLAVEPTLSVRAVALFAILFFWQFPHFMAIAWLYRDQYSRAGMKMWTVVDASGKRAGSQAVSASIALILVSLIPMLIGRVEPSWLLTLITSGLGITMLCFAVNFYRNPNDLAARWLLWSSLVYLPCLLGLLLLNPLI